MNSFINVLINRDGLSVEQAKNEFNWVKEKINSGEIDYFEIEDFLMCEYDLEPDYVMDFIY